MNGSFIFFPSKKLISWCDFYLTEELLPDDITLNKNINYTGINQTLQPNRAEYYVYNCFFHDMAAPDGGAINYEYSSGKLLIERCLFHNCRAERYTSSVRVVYGNCIIAFSCGQHCSSPSDGFSSVHNDGSRKINSVFDSTVSYCAASQYLIMYHSQGSIRIKSVNISYNKAQSYSALRCAPNKADEKTGLANDISYCSMRNNSATSFCASLTTTYGKSDMLQIIKNSNIIENAGHDIFEAYGKVEIVSCCFFGNGDPVFFTANENSFITIINCFTNSMRSNGNGDISWSGKVEPFILAIPFIETGSCLSSIDHIHNLFACKTNETWHKHLIYRAIFQSSLIFLLYSA